jgi:hypothetical protein
MPWVIKKEGTGYVVVTKETGKKHSKKPMTKAMALKQLAALQINVKK